MHTRAFSNVLNELLLKIEGIYKREGKFWTISQQNIFKLPWRHIIDNLDL